MIITGVKNFVEYFFFVCFADGFVASDEVALGVEVQGDKLLVANSVAVSCSSSSRTESFGMVSSIPTEISASASSCAFSLNQGMNYHDMLFL